MKAPTAAYLCLGLCWISSMWVLNEQTVWSFSVLWLAYLGFIVVTILDYRKDVRRIRKIEREIQDKRRKEDLDRLRK